MTSPICLHWGCKGRGFESHPSNAGDFVFTELKESTEYTVLHLSLYMGNIQIIYLPLLKHLFHTLQIRDYGPRLTWESGWVTWQKHTAYKPIQVSFKWTVVVSASCRSKDSNSEFQFKESFCTTTSESVWKYASWRLERRLSNPPIKNCVTKKLPIRERRLFVLARRGQVVRSCTRHYESIRTMWFNWLLCKYLRCSWDVKEKNAL